MRRRKAGGKRNESFVLSQAEFILCASPSGVWPVVCDGYVLLRQPNTRGGDSVVRWWWAGLTYKIEVVTNCTLILFGTGSTL